MIIAIDFDGTLTITHDFPEIGEPRLWLIERLKRWRKHGHKLILWTCREDVLPNETAHFSPRLYLTEAVNWCKTHGLEFDAVNKQLDEVNNPPGFKVSRKLFADIYIDDSASIFDDSQKRLHVIHQKLRIVSALRDV